jgi:hypothetical protein
MPQTALAVKLADAEKHMGFDVAGEPARFGMHQRARRCKLRFGCVHRKRRGYQSSKRSFIFLAGE